MDTAARQATLGTLTCPHPEELPDPALLDDVAALLAARDQLDGMITRRLRIIEARGAALSECGHSTRTWLVASCRLSPAEAARRVFVARRLDDAPLTAAATESGEIGVEAARAIVSTLPTLADEYVRPAEEILVQLARRADPTVVAVAGREIAERTLAAEDREAAAQRRHERRQLSLASTFDGLVSVSGLLDAETGEAVIAAVTALAQPQSPDDDRSAGQRRADALGAMARHVLSCGGLPDGGGERPHVVVTIDWDLLRGGPGVATLERTAGYLSPAAARRWACDAGLLPAVLGSDGAVLDIGRTTRVWPAAIRRAARLRDGGCVFPGCPQPLDRCDLHHLVFWALGGRTSLENSAHLCGMHHRLVHEDGWTAERVSPMEVRFVPPPGRTRRAPPESAG